MTHRNQCSMTRMGHGLTVDALLIPLGQSSGRPQRCEMGAELDPLIVRNLAGSEGPRTSSSVAVGYDPCRRIRSSEGRAAV